MWELRTAPPELTQRISAEEVRNYLIHLFLKTCR